MFCPKCAKQIADGSSVCPFCTASTGVAVDNTVTPFHGVKDTTTVQQTPVKKKMKTGCLLAILIPIALAVSFIVFIIVTIMVAPKAEPITDANGNIVTTESTSETNQAVTTKPSTTKAQNSTNPQTTKAPETTKAPLEPIRLKDGEIGIYGKIVKLDEYDYCWYYVPPGKYSVTFINPIGNWQTVYVCKNKTITNYDGYSETVDVFVIQYDGSATKKTIVVGKDEHVQITLNTEVVLTPLN